MLYVPFASDIEIPFYAALASHKINHDRLDDSARRLLGLYEIRPSDKPENSSRMQIHGNALISDEVPAGYYRAEGMIKNVNTIEDYRNYDRGSLLQQAGRTVWDAIRDGTIYSCPSLLASFVVLSFADLKRYHFYYWFAFPALQSEPSWAPVTEPGQGEDSHAKPMPPAETSALVERVQTWRYGVDARQHAFFLAKKYRRLQTEPSTDEASVGEMRPTTPKTPTENLGFTWQVSSLSDYESGFFEGEYAEDCYVCFADPSTYPHTPGWPLRNLLALIKGRWKRDRVQILCYRDTQQQRDGGRSVIYDMELTKKPKKPGFRTAESTDDESALPKIVGWERNDKGKSTGRMADLTEYMDPKKLADQSVDLNLKLMKWRISPNLNLENIKNTKCLLLGAGTLGSYVARNLLGWGVRKITFVDNGRVSYSNPVRQPLFDFEDCLGGGAKKAVRASEALKRIYPGVDSAGHHLSVPMAGHPVADPVSTKHDFEQLRDLIDSHDVVFLLMDTRESRWLPTVMGKAAGKIVMNAAIGFDSFVVMRHGVKVESAPETELGCYFCNDVVAPADSVKDQTLDQQCTVTRPGIAAIASALLVELLVSILQHPQGPAAPAPTSPTEDRGDHPLGLVPHQIRGFLSTFQNMSIAGKSYNCCSACSDTIVNAYMAGGWDFVQKSLNNKGFVEELSGLAEVQRAAEAAAHDVEWEDEGDIEEEGEVEII